MSNKESNIEKTNFDAFIQAVGSEIEQAQVRLIVAANAQMLFHYWKIGNYILYHQQLHGWGSKIIKQLAKAIRLHYPEKKGYSERNLTYMCQFAKAYPLRALQSFIETDASLSVPTIQSVTNEVLKLNDKQFTQELTAQMQSIDCQSLAITQEVPAQFEDVGKTVSAIYRMGIREIEEVFLTSPIAKINWTSQMTILDSSLPLGLSYWYMKQSVEMGWSSRFCLRCPAEALPSRKQRFLCRPDSIFHSVARIYRGRIKGYPIQTGVCRTTELLHQCGG